MLLIPVLALVFLSVTTETSATWSGEWNTNSYMEVLENLIKNQSLLCPYIQTCDVASNVTRPQADVKYGYDPCCKTCSCEVSCVENRTCCPDFVVPENNMTFLEYLTANSASPLLSDLNLNQPESEKKMSCVKTQYGIFNKYDFYTMISSCDSNNIQSPDVKSKCSTMQSPNIDTIFSDLVPVISLDSRLTYKNVHCLMCGEEKNVTTLEWDVWLICYLFSTFPDTLPSDPVLLAVSILRSEILNCNFAMQLEDNIFKLVHKDLAHCSIDVIKSCPNQYTNKHIVKACQDYSWPIQTTDLLRSSFVYNNMACLLCNVASFEENCPTEFLRGEDVRLQLNIFGQEKSLSTSENDAEVINKLFPDRFGEIRCDRGYIFDETQRICRTVHCPSYFFLRNGSCYPTFTRLDGLTLRSFIEVKVAHLEVDDLDIFQEYLIKEVESILIKWILFDNFSLSFWGSNTFLDMFYLIIDMKCELIGENYLDRLAFIWTTFHNLTLNINTAVRTVTTKMTIAGPYLGVSVRWLTDNRKSTATFDVLKSTANKTALELLADQKTTHLLVVELSFCYSVKLSKNEYKRLILYSIQLPSNLTIARMGYRGFRNTDQRFVCAYSVMKEMKSFYIFSEVTDKQEDKQEKIEIERNFQTPESGDDGELRTDLKSLLALVSTCAVAIILIGVKFICKQITKKMETRSDT